MTISRGQMPRQLYGLGSLVKSITKPISKLAKSAKKIALPAAALYFGSQIPFGNKTLGSIFTDKIGGILTGEALKKGLGKIGGTLLDVGIGSLVGGGLDYLQRRNLPQPETRIMGRTEEELDEIEAELRKNYEDLGYEPGEIDLLVEQGMKEYGRDMNAYGGRIGYSDGTKPSADEAVTQQMVDQKQMAMVEDMLKRGMDVETIKSITGASDEIIQDRINFIKYGGAKVPIKKAYGGRIGYAFGDSAEDNAVQASGIMGLPLNQNPAGVTELDLRETGGFIPPVGVKEKADDIPAMLSNNEFVFTADAVRGMGGGDVDKGAERMYAMMKTLENGGRV